MEKSNDKSLAKELSAVEKELNVKEEEINAVIGLYKEVRAIKSMLNAFHINNIYIYIS